MTPSDKTNPPTSWVTEPEDDEGREAREVYAWAGLALYSAQCLEHEIVNTLGLVKIVPIFRAKRPMTRDEITQYQAEVDHIWDEEFQKTLGILVSSLNGSGIKIPASLDSDLRESLRLRNRLVHRYFRERAETWFSSGERRSIAEELRAMQEQFVKTDGALHQITSKLRNAVGMTDDKIHLIVELTKAGASEEEIERAISKLEAHK